MQHKRQLKTDTFVHTAAAAAAAVGIVAVASDSSLRIVVVAADIAHLVGGKQENRIAARSKGRCSASAFRSATISSVEGPASVELADRFAAGSANTPVAPIQALAVDAVASHTPSVEPASQPPSASAVLDVQSLIGRTGYSCPLARQPSLVLAGQWHS